VEPEKEKILANAFKFPLLHPLSFLFLFDPQKEKKSLKSSNDPLAVSSLA